MIKVNFLQQTHTETDTETNRIRIICPRVPFREHKKRIVCLTLCPLGIKLYKTILAQMSLSRIQSIDL